VRQSIRGYSDGLIALYAPAGPGRGTPLSTLASEVAAVRDVVAGSEDLQRALSDPDILVASRRGILSDLFGGRVDDATLRLLTYVLEADRATETVGDIEWLTERLDAAVHNMAPVGDVVLGTKGAEERVDGFATAILETVTDERGLSNIEDELFRFSRIVAGSPGLRDALSNRDYPVTARSGVVHDLLHGKASEPSVLLAIYLTKVGRPRDFEVLLGQVIDRVASESNRRLADVRSAVALNEQQERDMTVALSRLVGRDVEIRVTVDPSVVAGFVATIGDTVVDGSARHQLDLLKERLVMPEAQLTTGHITKEERH
jgi:F-type H+-transporting ATPase subunit delta